MASTGVFFPVVGSIAFAKALGFSVVTGLSIGASLAPTSLGFTAQLLKDFGALNTREGQFICTAAVIDDVLSLLLLAQITALQGDPTPFQIVLPFISSLGSIGVGVLILFMMSRCCKGVIDKINSWSEETPEQKKEKRRKKRHGEDVENYANSLYLVFLFAFATIFAWSCALVGSSALLGAYIAAIPFAKIPAAKHAWEHYVAKIVPWLMRVFFSATIGFTIPSLVTATGWTLRAFGIGAVLAIIAILGKMSTGLYSWQSNLRAVIGTSMCGRGEFSFLIINQSAVLGTVLVEEFVATIIGLLLTTIISPFMFIYAFKRVSDEWPPKDAIQQANQEFVRRTRNNQTQFSQLDSPTRQDKTMLSYNSASSQMIRSPTFLDNGRELIRSPTGLQNQDLIRTPTFLTDTPSFVPNDSPSIGPSDAGDQKYAEEKKQDNVVSEEPKKKNSVAGEKVVKKQSTAERSSVVDKALKKLSTAEREVKKKVSVSGREVPVEHPEAGVPLLPISAIEEESRSDLPPAPSSNNLFSMDVGDLVPPTDPANKKLE
eukprot:TRINITY_DN7299_c0_g1_i1.p2 TRINITY_DN7299_c0_g1~~TRINITY_DN7299_c0_g1_i1.p2  ORF type:complete len:638 (+),score=155.24 TRINITY_DN7299_c0_g1_i1:285-1916(+)